jgi:hypothetical protein
MPLSFLCGADSATVGDRTLLFKKKSMTDQILYLKCKRCNHESILHAELMDNLSIILPERTLQRRMSYLTQNRHIFKCSKCSNKNTELVLGTEKNEDLNTFPDLNQILICGSCGGDIEEGRLRVRPDTNVCDKCSRSVINLSNEEDSDHNPESCSSCNAVMVLILPQESGH